MLVKCPECNREISDQAENCPHCGHPLIRYDHRRSNTLGNAPAFLVVSIIAFLLSLFTPRLLLFFPLMATLGCATISLFRKERGRWGAVIVIVFGAGLFLLGESTPVTVSDGSSNLEAAEIAGWNWTADRSFGTNGAIKWNVQIKNKSSRNIETVRVEFSTYDRSRTLVATTFTYVKAIPVGGLRAEASYADLYGTEDTAAVRITSVRFAE